MSNINEKLMDRVLKDGNNVQTFMQELKRKNHQEPEFLQAAHDVAESIVPFMETHLNIKSIKY